MARKPNPVIMKSEGGPIRPTPRPAIGGTIKPAMRSEGGKVCAPAKKRKK